MESGICKNFELKTNYYIISRTMIGDRYHGQQDDNLLFAAACSNINPDVATTSTVFYIYEL